MIKTTQNRNNGISKEITVLNLIFFNSKVGLISQFANERNFCKSWAHMLAVVTCGMRMASLILDRLYRIAPRSRARTAKLHRSGNQDMS
jgi:hypothetical protein